MNIPAKNKIWITAYGILFGVWVGISGSGGVALGLVGFLTAVNFGILSYWANSSESNN